MQKIEDLLKAMKFERPDRIPVSCGILPAAWMKYRSELDSIVKRYPEVFSGFEGQRDYDAVGGTYVEGSHTDVWGCVWENVHTGRESIVTKHPVSSRDMIRALEIPRADAGIPHGFMYLRLQDLRGFEELMVDFADEAPELDILIEKVLAYNLRQVDLLLERLDETQQIVSFGDDLGMQSSLPMSPAQWRKYLKPCFAAIYAPIKKAGCYVYMHTDGHIHEIIRDLKDCGVDIINPQFRANGIDNLAAVCKGKICVDLDLDRQLFPFCTTGDIDDHVRETVEKLGSVEGGLCLKAEIDDGVPLENVEAILAALAKYSLFYADRGNGG